MAEAHKVTTVFHGPNVFTGKVCADRAGATADETTGLVSGMNEGNPGLNDHGFSNLF